MSTALAVSIYEVRVDVGDAIVAARVYDHGDHMKIPIAASLPDGGYVRAAIEVDRNTFNRALAIAHAHGVTSLRLADLVERATGYRPLVSIDHRPLLPR